MKKLENKKAAIFAAIMILVFVCIVAGSIGYYGAPRYDISKTIVEKKDGTVEYHYDDIVEIKPSHVGSAVVNAGTLGEEDRVQCVENELNPYTGKPVVDYSLRGEALYVPEGVGSVRPYMAWQLITDPTTKQYQLRMEAEAYDENDFGVINGCYAVAVKPYYGKIGDFIDVIQVDDSVLHCIIVDYKGDENVVADGVNARYYHTHKDVIEFVVNQYSWYNGDQRTVYQYHPSWNQNIKAIYNVGNYWGE